MPDRQIEEYVGSRYPSLHEPHLRLLTGPEGMAVTRTCVHSDHKTIKKIECKEKHQFNKDNTRINTQMF